MGTNMILFALQNAIESRQGFLNALDPACQKLQMIAERIGRRRRRRVSKLGQGSFPGVSTLNGLGQRLLNVIEHYGPVRRQRRLGCHGKTASRLSWADSVPA